MTHLNIQVNCYCPPLQTSMTYLNIQVNKVTIMSWCLFEIKSVMNA